MRLKGRVAAITGGALGIGRATARLFASEGATVVLGDVQVKEAEAVAKEITDAGGRALAVGVDVGDAGQVQAFVDRAIAELGRLDIMFANAGIAHSAPFLEHAEAQWHRVLRVNLTGVFLCCQIAARQMVKQGGGRIITTASINGFRGVENLVGYNTATALARATDELGYETLWLAEHHFQHEGYECIPSIPLLAVDLAHRTRRVKIGCAFNIVPTWHPLRLAEDYATADILTGGRVVFGVGRGYHSREVETFGNPMLDGEANRELFEEQVEIILKAF